MYSFLGRNILFSVFMWITLETLHITLNILICKPYLFFNTDDYLRIPCLADIFSFSLFMQTTSEIVHTHVYIQNTIVHEVLSIQPQIFYTCQPYFFPSGQLSL